MMQIHLDRLIIATVPATAIFQPTAASLNSKSAMARSYTKVACYRRVASLDDKIVNYPASIDVIPHSKMLGLGVITTAYRKLPPKVRLSIIRDAACWYSGGWKRRAKWLPIAAYDPDSGALVEAFTSQDLKPTEPPALIPFVPKSYPKR